MLWHEIVYVLSIPINGLTKYEIADRIAAAIGKHVTPEQVYLAIKYQWEKGNYSIYAD